MSDSAGPLSSVKGSDQRPEHPDFWCKRFSAGVTPWDAGKVPDQLVEFVRHHPAPAAVLIPGCGSAWEAGFLAQQGWPVTALDFSPQAVARAGEVLHGLAVDLVCDDFFTFEPRRPHPIIYERAFLCALPRKLWDDWGLRVAGLLPRGGVLVGFFFVCDQLKGPPFGILPDQLQALLAPNFDCVTDVPASDSIPVFAGRERWQVWRRR